MADFAKLSIQISSTGAVKVTDELKTIELQAGKTEKSVNSLLKMVRDLKSLMAVGMGIGGINSLIQMSDTMKSLNSQIRLVTTSTQEYKQVQRELFNISQHTYAGMNETISLYTRSTRALKEYGYSQQRVLDFTETLNKAMALGGRSAQEQSAALYQLSQALGSGRLQGDEFRSISENAPIILEVVAEYMGKSAAEVRKLSSEGVITSQIIVESMRSAREKIEAEFNELPITFGKAMTQMKDSVMSWVGGIESSTGVMGGLAGLISTLALNFDTLAKATLYAASAYTSFNLISSATKFRANLQGVGLMATGFNRLTVAINGTTTALFKNPLGLFVAGVIGAAYVFDQFISDLQFGSDVLQTTWGDVATGVWMDFKDAISDAGSWLKSTFDTATQEVGKYFGDIVPTVSQSLNELLAAGKHIGNRFIGIFDFSYQSIKLIWSNFPVAMRSFGKAAINGLVKLVEMGVNKIIDFLKAPIELLNYIAKSFGKDGGLVDTSGWQVRLDDFILPPTEAEKSFKKELDKIYNIANSKDYLGGLGQGLNEYLAQAGLRGKEANAQDDPVDLSQGGVSSALSNLSSEKKKGRGKSEVDQIRDFITAQKQKIQAQTDEISMIGLLASEREKLTAANQLEMEYQKLMIQLSPQYQSELTKQYELVKKQQEKLFKLKELTQADPIAGLKDGFAKFGDSAMDVMGNVSQITQQALGGMSGALTDLVMTGKADFRGLAKSIIKDISNMIIKMMIFNALKAGGKALGFDMSWMGGKSDGGFVFAHGGLAGFDDGGFTGYGGKYQPAGIVHKGEYVLTKEATSRLGVDYLDMLNYQKRSRGFSGGGGMSLPTVHTTTQNKPIKVEVNNYGQPMKAKVTQSEENGQVKLTVELIETMNKIAESAADRRIMNNLRAGGAFT
ncbi:phage tail tape measure protein, lambda family [Pasteurella testudinis DSM 23072]|uniref:Phage tail tape measure protein, lambda family n=1 Tax=Pasteurella testudinis DSM 23072 TaxID=1122938 RepID=A0A1W1V1Y0_9PAST|nr:phage tail tape measure protein [Pasteurella testudinis]SMB87308.1 phage tail tape measure protein, lambda family [Pasteurella testudinis DSM 23072]SUB51571.1 Phage-related minor tail protein [Pasteurella testudinis]SUB98522.1 Phage-related minor tail protein [Pasteurella testudinis]